MTWRGRNGDTVRDNLVMKRVNILFKLEMNFSYHPYFLPTVDALGF